EEVAGVDHALELRLADEVVVLRVALARPRRARSEGDRQPDVAVARQAGVDDAGLARAGRRRDDEESSAHGWGRACWKRKSSRRGARSDARAPAVRARPWAAAIR